MARKPAAAGLKVIINQQETWHDCMDVGSGAPSSLCIPSSGDGNLSQISPFSNMTGVFDDSYYGDNEISNSGSIASPAIQQTSAERVLAELALLEEIRVAQHAIELFLNNDILRAKQMLESKITDNMYASVAYSTILYLQAIMTVTAEDAKAASKALRETQALCAKRCRGRFSRSKRTEEQVHAELCHAECGLMLSALVISEDPGLTALVKAGLRFKSSHSTYQTCRNILRERVWSNQELRDHFESGVRLGAGSFNLIFSCVPSKHAKYLSIVGFSGKAKVGHSELKSGSDVNALRSVLCGLVLIGWETYGKIVLGCGVPDLDYATEILEPLVKQYPNGAVMLFLNGRLSQLRGQFATALQYFQRSITAQTDWKQYHHLCLWESMWCYAFMLNYAQAAALAHKLFKENQWSKTTYAYLTASFLLMMNCEESILNGENVSVKEMTREVFANKQRIAGHSLPPEKLAEKRCKRLIEQGKDLVLPAFEMSYVWGGLSALTNRPDIVQELLSLIDCKLAEIKKATAKERKLIHEDSVYLLKFFRGVCLSYLNQIEEACRVLDEVVKSEKDIVEDKFIPPHAAVEMAHLKIKLNDLDAAYEYCDKAMSFKNYFMQAKLELRIGATVEMIEEMEEASNKSSSEKPESLDNEFYTPPDSPNSQRKIDV